MIGGHNVWGQGQGSMSWGQGQGSGQGHGEGVKPRSGVWRIGVRWSMGEVEDKLSVSFKNS